MIFSCMEDSIHKKFVDISHQAIETPFFPNSVGLRSQALKLNFVTPETQDFFLKPTLSIKKVMDIFKDLAGESLSGHIFHQTHIGETVSMIYSPFYINDKIYDAILKKPVTAKLPHNFDASIFSGGCSDQPIQFLAALCPKCGWDLRGRRDAMMLNCVNCNSLWKPGIRGFKEMKFACIPNKENNMIYFPFWRINADISQITLESYADLARVANIPKAIKEEWKDIKFRFWSPGIFLSLLKKMTLGLPPENLSRKLPSDSEIYPVTLPIEEAIESLIINLAGFIKPKRRFLPKLQDIKITPKSFLLVYIPFEDRHHEYVQPHFNFALSKNHLTMASNL